MEDLGVKLINDELKNSYNEKLYEKLILNIIEIQKIPKKIFIYLQKIDIFVSVYFI